MTMMMMMKHILAPARPKAKQTNRPEDKLTVRAAVVYRACINRQRVEKPDASQLLLL